MRIRYWAALATALASAASIDWSSELLSNAGWLGGGASLDGHQESVVPVAVSAALVLFGLAVAIALRAGRGDRVRYEALSIGRRLAFAVLTLAGTFAIVTLMEACEMRFGGVSAFDPRSVFVEHAPAVFAGYAIVSALAGRLVAFCLRVAGDAGQMAAHAFGRFARVDRRDAAPAHASVAPGARPVPRRRIATLATRPLRAPPVLQLFHERLLT